MKTVKPVGFEAPEMFALVGMNMKRVYVRVALAVAPGMIA
jgi:hypothetical protein